MQHTFVMHIGLLCSLMKKKKKKQITTGVVFYRPGQEHGEVIGVIGLDFRASYLEMLLKETFPACGNSSYV